MPREHEWLPGHPRANLVRDVRRWLRSFGITPAHRGLWRDAWEWAFSVAVSYHRTTWPLPSEIAAQYVLLLLVRMKGEGALRLPHRAHDHLPAAVCGRIAAAGPIGLPAPQE